MYVPVSRLDTGSDYCWPAKGLICDGCRRQSVCQSFVVRCPSTAHISKTKQDRPIVTVEHYQEIA